jgi:signal transduction histidine kinase
MSTASRFGLAVDALIRRPAWWPVLVVFWAAIAAASFAWHQHELENYAQNSALQRGRLIVQMVETMRDWAAQQSHARGFADNSALMTRQLGELIQQDRDPNLKIHLTSLKLLNPANAPDAWEDAALHAFDAGSPERYGVDGDLFRFMAPLPTKASCLDCHAHQGHKVGDIRGGLSVSFPAQSILDGIAGQRRAFIIIHAIAFLLLSALSLSSLAALRRRLLDVDSARNDLADTEKMASLGRMVAGFAHEVNTPVGVAVGAVSQAGEVVHQLERMLEQDEVDEDEIHGHLSILTETNTLALGNLRRAAALVQSFKRTAVDQSSEAERDYDLTEIIADVRQNLHGMFKKTSITIEANCATGLRLHGPAGALEQLLTNLLTNSYIHGFANGTQAGTISIDAHTDGDTIVIDYRDDGAGMSAETVAHAFEPFYTTKRGGGGSGLGLYLAYEIATRKLGGSIQCNSMPNHGSQFILRYPARYATHPTSQ